MNPEKYGQNLFPLSLDELKPYFNYPKITVTHLARALASHACQYDKIFASSQQEIAANY